LIQVYKSVTDLFSRIVNVIIVIDKVSLYL